MNKILHSLHFEYNLLDQLILQLSQNTKMLLLIIMMIFV